MLEVFLFSSYITEQEASNEGKDQLKQKKQLLTDKMIFCNKHVLVDKEIVESVPSLSDIWEEAIHSSETEIDDSRKSIQTTIFNRSLTLLILLF